MKYYLMLHYIKLDMTMNKHNVLQTNNKYIKNIKFINYFICGKLNKNKLLNKDLNLIKLNFQFL